MVKFINANKKNEDKKKEGEVASGSLASDVTGSLSAEIGSLKAEISGAIETKVGEAIKNQMKVFMAKSKEQLEDYDNRCFNYFALTCAEKKKPILENYRQQCNKRLKNDEMEPIDLVTEKTPREFLQVEDKKFYYFSSSAVIESIQDDDNYSLTVEMLEECVEWILLMACFNVKGKYSVIFPEIVDMKSDAKSMKQSYSKKFFDQLYPESKDGVGGDQRFFLLFFVAKIDERYVIVIVSKPSKDELRIECLEMFSNVLSEEQITVLREFIFLVLDRKYAKSDVRSSTIERHSTLPILKAEETDHDTTVCEFDAVFDVHRFNLAHYEIREYNGEDKLKVSFIFVLSLITLKILSSVAIVVDGKSGVHNEYDALCGPIMNHSKENSYEEVGKAFKALDEFVLLVLHGEYGRIKKFVGDEKLDEMLGMFTNSKTNLGESNPFSF
jgi:hypothetical protein